MAKLLIAGATGLVGKLALEQALADERVTRVIALTRRPIAPAGAKLENIVIDFSRMPATADWWRVDGVICALGTTRANVQSPSAYREIDYEYPLAIARNARSHGATRLAVVTSLGADPDSFFAYPRLKGELERDLTKIGFPSLTLVRPSVLAGPREEQRPGERMSLTILGFLGPLLPRSLRVSPADSVAASLVEGAITGPPGVHIETNRELKAPARRLQ